MSSAASETGHDELERTREGADAMRREDRRAAALAVLGLSAGATREQIAGAYRRAVGATHPDRCSDADAGEQFAAVVRAYQQALADPPAPEATEPPTPAAAARPRARPRFPTVPLVAGPVHYQPYRMNPSTRPRA
jgi:hypothetical protein